MRVWRQGEAGLPGLGSAQRLQLAPDGVELFVSGYSDDTLTVLGRISDDSGSQGELNLRETIFDDGSRTDHFGGPTDMAASTDNKHLYVVGNY